MNKSLLLGLILALLSFVCMGQNELPRIENVSVAVNEKDQLLEFAYDVFDQEEPEVTVSLSISDDQGQRYLLKADNAQGDVGTVPTGAGKRIRWHYGHLLTDFDEVHFKIVADDGHRIPVQELIDQIDTNRLRQTMIEVTLGQHHQSEEGYKSLQIVREYIDDTYTAQGLTAETQAFEFGGYKGLNVIGKQAGQVDEASNIILFTHYDGRKTKPGSMINCNGIVGVLELSRILSNYSFGKSIRYAAFDLSYPEYNGANQYIWLEGGFPKEEQIDKGYYINGIGSDVYQAHTFTDMHKAEPSDTWTEKDYNGEFVFVFGNEQSADMVNEYRALSKQYVPEMKFASMLVNGYGERKYTVQNGDVAAFWYRKYKAVYVTTWQGTRPQEVPKDKPYAESALELNSLKAMAAILKVTLAHIVANADLQHCGIYEASLNDHLKL